MSSSTPPPDKNSLYEQQLRNYRRRCAMDLAAWVCQDTFHAIDFVHIVLPRLTVEQLEDVMDDLDGMYGDAGPSAIDSGAE